MKNRPMIVTPAGRKPGFKGFWLRRWIPRLRQRRMTVIGLVLTFSLSPLHAADVYLNLQSNAGSGKPLGVGIAPFASITSADTPTVAQTLRGVIREDLLFSRLFSVVEGGPAPAGDKIEALQWNGVGAQVVISGEVRIEGDQIRLMCQIFDVATQKVLYGKEGQGTRANIRRLAHLMADDLQYQLSGQPGIFHSRIVFVNQQNRTKELYVMDYDGANARRLTGHKSISLLPKMSPDGKTVVYNSYKAGNPDAFLIDFQGGASRELSGRQGLNTAPNWSPDGQTLALTMSRGGDPELYLVNKTGQIVRRLTYTPGVDTSPSFSPNGQQIAFVSDRSGTPELYVMDATGANVQRLTYGQYTDSPAWSPKGNLIAYERQRTQGRYDIWLIDPQGRGNRQISEAGVRNEHPSWSPDGRFLAYMSDREGKQKICLMGADGSSPHCVTDLPGNSAMPSWGP